MTPPLLFSRLLDSSPISQTSRIVVQSHASRASVVAFAATTPLQVSVRRLCTSIVLHLICRSVRTRNCAQTKPWWAHPPVQLSQLIDGRSRLDPATSALCCGTSSLIFLFWSRPFCRRQRCIITRPVTAPASSFHASSRRNCR